MAKQPDGETGRASDWSPGRVHWWTTTCIAIIGAVVGGTSLIMNFFYQPSPPPTTIESGHSEFMKLSYADRIDRCVPHISEHLTAWRDRWREALDEGGGSHQKAPVPYAALGDGNAPGQAIVNTYLAIVNYAEKLAPTDEGENLLSCVYAPVLKMDPAHAYPDVDSLVGSGNETPKADNLVVAESPVYEQGEFAGVTAEGRASKIVEVVIRPGASEAHRELGFAVVAGHDQGVRMRALNASVDSGDPQWMSDVRNYRGF
ncbi:hypothetical protein Mycch_2514 [Mycolicibacterium chubuense NBB4]|uniref:Uncharacterized protein n=1 Tax=Mycolicibacterium chubuense (strain NBB4) TaxID=710421 RepID=I4BJ30_MYCCN|nr:hypothetical protein [Mycolicibacterium chubuense]AFM17287.1 hypothetical protein Mycch_2514 [Mycolicibacterium chubuense NBB4]